MGTALDGRSVPWTSGPASDLAMEASFTPQLSYGYYSPYIGVSLGYWAHPGLIPPTAQYQYIPALASLKGEQLALTLNTPPSFHNPKSVMVAALPAVEPAQLASAACRGPQGHLLRQKVRAGAACGRRTAGVLHRVHARCDAEPRGDKWQDHRLPARADAQQGGFVVDTSGLGTASLGDSVRGSLHGYWGFDAYQGPSFQLVNAHAQTWQLTGGDEAALIVGRQDTIHLRADSVSCVDDVMLKDPAGKDLKAEWKTVKAE